MPQFTFDDGNTSDLWAASILSLYGLSGVFFVNDKPGIEYDVTALLAFGMQVGNHTSNHLKISEATEQQIIESVLPFNDKLKTLGASGEWFSYPFSSGKSRIITDTFKYIYRGYEQEHDDTDGEISRVTVTKKPLDIVLSYTKPLQLHGIETGQWMDISRDWFIQLCQKRSQ